MKRTVFFTLFLFALLWTNTVQGLSIRVLPGGVPVMSPEQLVAEGFRLGNSQLLRQAWDGYEKAVQLDPKLLEGYVQLGRIFFHLSLLHAAGQNDFERAREYAQKAVDMAPNDAEAHRVLALVLSGKGSYLNAMDELQLALHLNPGNEFVLCDMAIIHLAMREPKKAIETLDGKSLRNGWSYFVLAMAWLQQDQKGKAMIQLNKAERFGFSEYWIDQARNAIQKGLPISLPFMK